MTVCPLCRRYTAPENLRESHFIPKALYYVGNKTLQFATRAAKGEVQKHINDLLLCDACEHLLDEKGESEVLLHVGVVVRIEQDSITGPSGSLHRSQSPAKANKESSRIPNSLLADIHDRMPVILREEDYDLWLDPGVKDVKTLGGLLVSFDAAKMRSSPVSRRI
jgi:hypothetical protein